ncbi:hypothetical protein LCGC14_2813100, partial [marine sediment metagenome]
FYKSLFFYKTNEFDKMASNDNVPELTNGEFENFVKDGLF